MSCPFWRDEPVTGLRMLLLTICRPFLDVICRSGACNRLSRNIARCMYSRPASQPYVLQHGKTPPATAAPGTACFKHTEHNIWSQHVCHAVTPVVNHVKLCAGVQVTQRSPTRGWHLSLAPRRRKMASRHALGLLALASVLLAICGADAAGTKGAELGAASYCTPDHACHHTAAFCSTGCELWQPLAFKRFCAMHRPRSWETVWQER